MNKNVLDNICFYDVETTGIPSKGAKYSFMGTSCFLFHFSILFSNSAFYLTLRFQACLYNVDSVLLPVEFYSCRMDRSSLSVQQALLFHGTGGSSLLQSEIPQMP